MTLQHLPNPHDLATDANAEAELEPEYALAANTTAEMNSTPLNDVGTADAESAYVIAASTTATINSSLLHDVGNGR
jgi:hypothetical protein